MKRDCEACVVMFDGFHATGKLDMAPAIEHVIHQKELGREPELCPQHRDAFKKIVSAARVQRERDRRKT